MVEKWWQSKGGGGAKPNLGSLGALGEVVFDFFKDLGVCEGAIAAEVLVESMKGSADVLGSHLDQPSLARGLD